MEIKFYKCNHCGSIALKVVDSGAPLICCGEPMVELVAGSQDAALEKHVPEVKVDGNSIHVNVGSVDHPMQDEHFIQFICLSKETGAEIHTLKPADAPATDFYIDNSEHPKSVFEYCNLHGLWKKDL